MQFNPGNNVTILDSADSKPPVTGNAFVGGRYNTKYRIPEYAAETRVYARIREADMYLIDKEGNRTLIASFDEEKRKFEFIENIKKLGA